VRTYNDNADSTIPSVPKKRKFDADDDEEEVKVKVVKTEDDEDVSNAQTGKWQHAEKCTVKPVLAATQGKAQKV